MSALLICRIRHPLQILKVQRNNRNDEDAQSEYCSEDSAEIVSPDAFTVRDWQLINTGNLPVVLIDVEALGLLSFHCLFIIFKGLIKQSMFHSIA